MYPNPSTAWAWDTVTLDEDYLNGGVLLYEGGGLDPANLPLIAFVDCIFDHNMAKAKAVASIMATGSKFDAAGKHSYSIDQTRGMAVVVEGCLFFRNDASVSWPVFSLDNFWPIRMSATRSSFIENTAGYVGTAGYGVGNHFTLYYSHVRSDPVWAKEESLYVLQNVKFDWTPSRPAAVGLGPGGAGVGLLMENWPERGMNGSVVLRYNFDNVSISNAKHLWANNGFMFYCQMVVPEHTRFIYTLSNIDLSHLHQDGSLSYPGAALWMVYTGPVQASRLTMSKSRVTDCGNPSVTSDGPIYIANGYARFLDSEFRHNFAGSGGAITMGGGGELMVERCVFAENTAAELGGAIAIRLSGVGASAAIINSVFHANTVKPANTDQLLQYTLQVKTTQYPDTRVSIGADLCSPIVQVDDGQIFGIGWHKCEAARRMSAQGLLRGLAPSWPNSSKACANATFTSHSTFSRVLSLGLGRHIIKMGCIAESGDSTEALGWGASATAEIVGILEPIRPTIKDDRTTVRHPGCFYSATPLTPEGLCPRHEAMWSAAYPFHVSVGRGGAMALVGASDVHVLNTQVNLGVNLMCESQSHLTPGWCTRSLSATKLHMVAACQQIKPGDSG